MLYTLTNVMWAFDGDTLVLNETQRLATRDIVAIKEGKRWFSYPVFLLTIALAIFCGVKVGGWLGFVAGWVAFATLAAISDATRPFVLYIRVSSNEVVQYVGGMVSVERLRDELLRAMAYHRQSEKPRVT